MEGISAAGISIRATLLWTQKREERRAVPLSHRVCLKERWYFDFDSDTYFVINDRLNKSERAVPWEMEEGLIKVEAVVKATETLMLGLAEGLVFIHLPVAVEVGPSLLIRQNLWEDNLCHNNFKETMIQKVKQTERATLETYSLSELSAKACMKLHFTASFYCMICCDTCSPTTYDFETLMNISSALGSLFLSGCLKESPHRTSKMETTAGSYRVKLLTF